MPLVLKETLDSNCEKTINLNPLIIRAKSYCPKTRVMDDVMFLQENESQVDLIFRDSKEREATVLFRVYKKLRRSLPSVPRGVPVGKLSVMIDIVHCTVTPDIEHSICRGLWVIFTVLAPQMQRRELHFAFYGPGVASGPLNKALTLWEAKMNELMGIKKVRRWRVK